MSKQAPPQPYDTVQSAALLALFFNLTKYFKYDKENDNAEFDFPVGQKEAIDAEIAAKVQQLIHDGANPNVNTVNDKGVSELLDQFLKSIQERTGNSLISDQIALNEMSRSLDSSLIHKTATEVNNLREDNRGDIEHFNGVDVLFLYYASHLFKMIFDAGASPLHLASNFDLHKTMLVLINESGDVNALSVHVDADNEDRQDLIALWRNGGESAKSIEPQYLGTPLTSALELDDFKEIDNQIKTMILLLSKGTKLRHEDAVRHFDYMKKEMLPELDPAIRSSAWNNLQSKFFLEITKNYVDLNKLPPNLQASLGRANTAKDEENSGIFSRSIEKIEVQIANLKEAAQNFYRADKALLDNPFVKIEAHNPIVKELFDSIIAHEQLEELSVSSAEVSLSSGDTHGGYHVENNSHTDDLKVTGAADLDNV